MKYWVKKFFSDPSAHWDAFCEVLVVVALSITPFVGLYITKRGAGSEVFVEGLLAKGQIFALIWGLSGSVLYIAFASKPHNGPKTTLGFLSLFLLFPVVFMSGFDPSFSSIVDTEVNRWGYYGFLALIFFYYSLLFFENLSPPDPSESIDRDTSLMADQARELNK